MNETAKPYGGSILRRWSRLKSEAREKDGAGVPVKSADAAAMPAGIVPSAEAAAALDAPPIVAATTARGAPASADDSLPPVESLTIDSDFSAFMQPAVNEALKRRALKQLFRDPHFNVMDGLDVYIDDYSKPDPIPPEIVREMVQGRYIFDPPATRINAEGHVEDIPEEEIVAMERDASATPAADSAEAGTVVTSPLSPAEIEATVLSPLPGDAAASTAAGVNADAGAPSDLAAKAAPAAQ